MAKRNINNQDSVSELTDSANTNFLINKEGVWTIQDEGERPAFESLGKDTDRAAAIVGGSIIDVRLEFALKKQMRQNKKAIGRVFDQNGALRTFSAKIDIAYLYGVISDHAWHDLHIMRDIRNQFAHDLGVNSFSVARVRDKLSNLRLIDTMVAEQGQGPGSHVFSPIPGRIPRISVRKYHERRLVPRERFIITASLFASALGMNFRNYIGEVI